jgi:hypothetical protein
MQFPQYAERPASAHKMFRLAGAGRVVILRVYHTHPGRNRDQQCRAVQLYRIFEKGQLIDALTRPGG